MRFLFLLVFLTSILAITSCKGSNGSSGSATITPSPATSAPLPGSAGASPRASIANKPTSQVPPNLDERFRRALTDEEIERLPPATRDMIKRAQGKLPPTPAPKK